jgi:hypothetical protein
MIIEGLHLFARVMMPQAGLLSFLFIALTLSVNATAQPVWRVDRVATAGPLAQLELPRREGKARMVFVSFEYARQCDPILSISEMTGYRLGNPKTREVLRNSRIGVYFNGTFQTSHAGLITYDNGYEAGFSISNELLLGFLTNLDSMSFVTPNGERIPLPKPGFREALYTAMDICRSRMR